MILITTGMLSSVDGGSTDAQQGLPLDRDMRHIARHMNLEGLADAPDKAKYEDAIDCKITRNQKGDSNDIFNRNDLVFVIVIVVSIAEAIST